MGVNQTFSIIKCGLIGHNIDTAGYCHSDSNLPYSAHDGDEVVVERTSRSQMFLHVRKHMDTVCEKLLADYAAVAAAAAALLLCGYEYCLCCMRARNPCDLK
jgi:hypothetical protein